MLELLPEGELEMRIIELNVTNYEYDVHAMVGAFFPGEQIKVQTPESKAVRDAGGHPSRVSVRLHDEGAVLDLDGAVYRWDWPGPGQQEHTPGNKVTDGVKYKEGFKRFLYQSLCEATGKTLPWGDLTGIRPTKIAFSLLEQGMDDEEIIKYYREKYFVGREKAELSVGIAKRERELLSGIHGPKAGCGYSLYVGIPFCPTTCLYCSFTSFPIGGYRKMVDTYIDCLIRELEYVAGELKGDVLDCVYIGGGTPTTLEAGQLERLLCALRRLFDFSSVKEFTVEAGRADSITEEKLQVLYRYGVDRISINPQTMIQKTLDIIGRKASVAQVEEAYVLARKVGFDNINMDLILGLPGESEDDVRYTVGKVAGMAPDSLTVHSLAVKRASMLNRWVQENGVSMLRNTDETMRIAAEGAAGLGLVPYYLYRQKNMSGNFENVGYAREGKLGLYNILIMEEVQTILACGAGSISKRVYPDGRIERCENVKDVSQYIGRIGEMIERKHVLFGD